MLLCSADKLQRNLLVGTDDTAQGESCEHALCHLFADLSWRNEVVLLVSTLFVLEVSETLQELELIVSGLRTVVYQEGWVLSAFAHVDRAKVKGALDATAFVEHDREGLFDAGGTDLHNFVVFLTRTIDSNFLAHVLADDSECFYEVTAAELQVPVIPMVTETIWLGLMSNCDGSIEKPVLERTSSSS